MSHREERERRKFWISNNMVNDLLLLRPRIIVFMSDDFWILNAKFLPKKKRWKIQKSSTIAIVLKSWRIKEIRKLRNHVLFYPWTRISNFKFFTPHDNLRLFKNYLTICPFPPTFDRHKVDKRFWENQEEFNQPPYGNLATFSAQTSIKQFRRNASGRTDLSTAFDHFLRPG